MFIIPEIYKYTKGMRHEKKESQADEIQKEMG